MANRFDVNNIELNKRRFNDQYSHIVQANKFNRKKTKYVCREVCLSLTPDRDRSAEKTSQDNEPESDRAAAKFESGDTKSDLLHLGESSSEAASRQSYSNSKVLKPSEVRPDSS